MVRPGSSVAGRYRLIYELASIVGVDPEPRTLRELDWMAEAKRRDAWEHTAQVSMILANAHRDPKHQSTPYSVWDFFPFPRPPQPKPPKVPITVLRDLFVGQPSGVAGPVRITPVPST